MQRIRTAVVGAGHLGTIHARILKTLDRFDLTVVVDPAESARAAAAERFGVPVAADLRPWIDRVDAVVLASPTSCHFAAARDCLQAGLHAFVEKPLTATVEEASALVDTAARTGTTLQVGHVERFNPAWTAARPHLAAPRFIECVREGAFSFRSTDIGVVLDLMIHDIDLVLALTSAPLVDVEACGAAYLGAHEDTAYARLRFADGCVAVLHASRVAPTATRRMKVRTDALFAALDFQTKQASLVRLDPRLRDGRLRVESMSTEERLRWKDRLTTELLRCEELATRPVDAVTAELLDFAEAVQDRRRPTVAGVDGLEAVRVAERILAALRAGQQPPARSTHRLSGPHWKGTAVAADHVRIG